MNNENLNSGALFKNNDKIEKANEADTSKWADYQGKINIEGKDFYISAWMNKSKSGVKYLGLSVKPVPESNFPEKPESLSPESSDIPF